MPIVVINTNIQKSVIPEGFLKGFSQVYAEAVGRDVKAVYCTLNTGVDMMKGGTDDPTGVITLHHTISQDTDGRRATTKTLLNYIQTQLKLSDELMSRFAVIFLKPGRDEIGTCKGLLSDL